MNLSVNCIIIINDINDTTQMLIIIIIVIMIIIIINKVTINKRERSYRTLLKE